LAAVHLAAKGHESNAIRNKPSQAAFTCKERKLIMKKHSLFKSIMLAFACATLAITTLPANAGVVKGHAGTTFTLTPVEFDVNGNPTKFTHTVDGVVRVFEIGNCTFHADVIVYAPKSATDPFLLVGTFRITNADGTTVLIADASGTGTADPANPSLFLNFHYDVIITGGTGLMTNARGTADVDGFAMFTSASTGKATWLLEGNVATHGHND
jgi:hypothetical protein